MYFTQSSKDIIFIFSLECLHYICVIDQACSVKMAGYWPSSFFCALMDRDEVEVHKNAKKERGQYPAILTEQAWSIKDLLYGFTFKLKLQQQNKTGHETALCRPVQDLFSVHFWISM